jgi:hypothetical protein
LSWKGHFSDLMLGLYSLEIEIDGTSRTLLTTLPVTQCNETRDYSSSVRRRCSVDGNAPLRSFCCSFGSLQAMYSERIVAEDQCSPCCHTDGWSCVPAGQKEIKTCIGAWRQIRHTYVIQGTSLPLPEQVGTAVNRIRKVFGSNFGPDVYPGWSFSWFSSLRPANDGIVFLLDHGRFLSNSIHIQMASMLTTYTENQLKGWSP